MQERFFQSYWRLQQSSSSSSLVFFLQAGLRHPPPPLFSSLSSSLHFCKRSFHKIILSFGLFPNNLPSSTSLSSPFPLNTCPIQFFFLSRIVFTRHLFCPTIDNTSSFFILSCQHNLSSLLQSHISRASNLSISALRSVHVSHPYNTTGHTSTFTSLVFNILLSPFVKSFFLLLNASFASAILVFTSLRLLPSSEIMAPKYLKLSTCSTLCPSIVMLTTPSPSLHITIAFVFLNINLHVKLFSSVIQFVH